MRIAHGGSPARRGRFVMPIALPLFAEEEAACGVK